MNLLNITILLLSALCGSPCDYPKPEVSKTLLFYIQRSHNTNTVIYEANFDDTGMLNPDKPINIHWVLYEKEGRVEPLTYLENNFAFGVKHKALKNTKNKYSIQLVSYKKLKLQLIQTEPFQAKIVHVNNDSIPKLHHVFVQANDNGLWTKVKFLDVYTHDSDSEKLNMKKIMVD